MKGTRLRDAEKSVVFAQERDEGIVTFGSLYSDIHHTQQRCSVSSPEAKVPVYGILLSSNDRTPPSHRRKIFHINRLGKKSKKR
jgi:hypothetical protein